MMINNETGTIQPVDKIAEAAHKRGVLFHTDAVAAYGHIPIDVRKMDIDLLSASSHKFGGPKGAGFLYVRENLKLPPLIVGGSQERGRRGGSENVPGIIGMAAAAGIMHGEMDDNLARRKELDSYFIRKLKECPLEYRINGPIEYDGGRLPGSFNITLTGMNAEELIVRLGRKGICISAGAACTSSNDEGSHVLKAMGLAGAAVRETVRITLSENNTIDEIDKLFTELCKLGGRS
jgi:cysteine desulfurase